MKRHTPLRRAIVYGGVFLLAAFLFGPFLLVGTASLVEYGDLLTFPPNWFAHGVSLGNYEYVLTGQVPQSFLREGGQMMYPSQEVRHFPQSVLNSFSVALAVMLINLVLGCFAGYAYSRLRFPLYGTTFNFVLFSRLIPTVALAIPYYLIVQSAGLLNNPVSLIAIYAVLTLPFTVLLLTLHFRSVPEEVEESAQVEGASNLQIMLHITLPLSLPSLIGTGLFAFMLAYSEFLFALLLTTKAERWTMAVNFGVLVANPDVSWGLLNSCIIMGILPTALLVLPVWRFMVRGLAAGAGR